ncbi:hypothetical protein NPJ82_07270 [Sphingomonas sp. NY01]|uniref:type II toxin-antitoxin system RelE family toxin n=1 Tax=Sphingomonas sp. NY01 TaxID=2968057 RepID=UPI00315D5633
MSSVERRFRLLVHADVDRDIEDLEDHDPDQAAAVIQLIEELEEDRQLCEKLVDVSYDDHQIQSVTEFWAVQNKGYNVYRVRLWEVDDWRVLTAVDHRQNLIGILYIMKRDENYDATVQDRVIKAYEDLGFTKLGRH